MHNWYLDLYTRLNDYIYGGTAVVGTYEDMVLVIVSTFLVIFAVILPLAAVIWLCKKLLSWWG